MAQRKSWSPQEDSALKHLYQVRGVRKWSAIAKLMVDEYGLQGRNGKQCRQRYHNHLDSRITKECWRLDEEKHLIRLHNKLGNRWAMIARELPGRTDNCVKNHFYSKIRKSIRKLNKSISEYFRKEFKELKVHMVYKIVEIAEQRYRIGHKSPSELQNTCYEIKNKILQHSYEDAENPRPMKEEQILEAKELIAKVVEISRLTKVKAKKKRSRAKSFELDDDQDYDSGFMEFEESEESSLLKKSTRRRSVEQESLLDKTLDNKLRNEKKPLKFEYEENSHQHTNESSNHLHEVPSIFEISKLPNIFDAIPEFGNQTDTHEIKMEQYDFLDGNEESILGFNNNCHATYEFFNFSTSPNREDSEKTVST